MTNYKYNEGEILKEIVEYVNGTYAEHYSKNKFQATEFIIDSGHGIGFTVGNILKYAQRYGRKGTPEDWRKDMLKVIHYAIMALHIHDQEHNANEVLELLDEVTEVPIDSTSGQLLKTDFGCLITPQNNNLESSHEDTTITEAVNVLSKMAKAERLAAENRSTNILATKKSKNKINVVPNPTEWSSDDIFRDEYTFDTNDKESK